MRRKAPGAAGIGHIATRRHRLRVDFERLMTLFERQQFAGVPNDVGVGDATFLAQRRRIGRQRISERAEQGLPSLVLQFPFWRAHVAVAIRNRSVLERESVQHAVTGKPVMVGVARRKLGIGTVAIERAVQFRRYFSGDLQILEVFLSRNGSEISCKIWVYSFGNSHEVASRSRENILSKFIA